MGGKRPTAKIIAGSLKNRTLLLPSSETTRSSKAILRESLFNVLQFEIIDSVFIEVFAGSGSVGLEAISRGARRALFLERDREAFKTLQENIRTIAPSQAMARQGDSFELFPALFNEVSADEPCYVYCDPPFSIREGQEEVYDQTIQLIEGIPNSRCKMVIIEHMTGLNLPETIGGFALHKQKKFGNSSLAYYLPVQ